MSAGSTGADGAEIRQPRAMFDWTVRMMNVISSPAMTMSTMAAPVSTAFSLNPPPDRIVRLDVRAMMRHRPTGAQGGSA